MMLGSEEVQETTVCNRIRRRAGKLRTACAVFEGQPWRSKDETLVALGFTRAFEAHWFEVSEADAKGLLSAALARDLCYGQRRMPDETAASLVAQFLELLPPKSRYFTNSSIPYHRRKHGSWSFHSISNRTVDTGVIAKCGELLCGLLWVADSD